MSSDLLIVNSFVNSANGTNSLPRAQQTSTTRATTQLKFSGRGQSDRNLYLANKKVICVFKMFLKISRGGGVSRFAPLVAGLTCTMYRLHQTWPL